mmetsp:Transcript_9162/g.26330  ORF Transcript_9162/g.26330 Transcript_9162/m.26330 type:complete len:233 (-) Transcript_9162:369-1067(-)
MSTPFSRKVLSDATTTNEPMTLTSSIASLRRWRDSAMARGANVPTSRVVPPRSVRSVEARIKLMSKIGRHTAQPAYKNNAMPEFTSPCAIHRASDTMLSQTLTSLRRSSPTCMNSKMTLSSAKSGRTWYSSGRSMCRDMLGRLRPITNKMPKSDAKVATKHAAPPKPIRSLEAAGASEARSSEGSAGKWMPKDETVEPTQKMQKEVKPKSMDMPLRSSGGLSRPRIKFIKRM